jgi:hypothetical protein
MRGKLRIVHGLMVAAVVFTLPAPAHAINVAASTNGGSASQSSTCFSAPASLANDGNVQGHFFNDDSVSHTCGGDPLPTNDGLFDFWEVALGGGDNAIDRIVLYNRTDCCTERIDPFRLTLLNDGVAAFTVDVPAFVQDITAPGISGMTFDLSGQIGDTVRVQLTQQNLLHMAEVEVFNQLVSPVPEPGTVAWLCAAVLTLTLAVARPRPRLTPSGK